MLEAMQARYRITESDYVRAGALFGRSPKWFLVLAVLALVVALAALAWGPGSMRGPILGGIMGGVIGGSLLTQVIRPWMLRRHYRAYKAIQEEQSVVFSDTGLQFISSMGDARLSWDKILKWRFNADYVLVYPMPQLYYIVPTSIATQGFDVDRLKAELACHVGPAT
ncbi:YcxB family protein [Ottowia sp.]|uniref:YcxB family protein n=1 Tax=Ottowia sp. TaxID=1898956 RepID=UPI003A8682A1